MLEPSKLLQRSSAQGWSSQPWTEGDRVVLTTSEPALFSSPDLLVSVSAPAVFSSAPPSLLPDLASPTPETALPQSDDLNFEYATIAAGPSDTVGNTLALARDLGLLSSPLTITESVGSSDPNDFYTFSLATDSTFDLSLTGLSADADVQLLDRMGNVIAYSDASEAASEAIRRVLSAGSYAIRVYPYSGSTAYSLNLAVSAPGRSFSTSSGYGLVNAAAAVARAIEQPSFADVAAEGAAWDVTAVNAPEAWANGYTGQGVVVAVVDSGVDYTHPDLINNIWVNSGETPNNGIDDDRNGYIDDVRGWDFVDRDNAPLDSNGHGTHVAGTIAAENNSFGITGVAYNARILPVRVLGTDGTGYLSDVARGIRYAADQGSDVINLSLGGGYSREVDAAIQYAIERGSFVTIAAGNEAAKQPSFPASLAGQSGIAVGAVDRENRVASFSNQAGTSAVNYVVAPGVGIYSTTPNNSYQSFNGTSMATPHVAGVAALVLSANSNLTPIQVSTLLIETASSIEATA